MIRSKLKYSSRVIQTDISDHFAPILSIQAEKIKKLPPLQKTRILDHKAIEKMKVTLQNIKWDVFSELDHENFVDTFQKFWLIPWKIVLVNKSLKERSLIQIDGLLKDLKCHVK